MMLAGGFGGLLAIGLLPGCKDRRIETYQVAKELVLAAPADHAQHAHGTAVPAASAEASSSLSWAAPAHWKTKPGYAMRRASFGVPLNDGTEADLSITVLGGAAGGLPANVNRWRTQLGLPELGADEITRTGEAITAGGVTFSLFDLAGKPNGDATRMLAAIAEFQGQSWFFKFIGSDAAVAAEKPAFVAFLRSVKS